MIHAERRDWSRAIKELEEGLKIADDPSAPGRQQHPQVCYLLALCHLAQGDEVAYRVVCELLWSRRLPHATPQNRFWTVWACCPANAQRIAGGWPMLRIGS